MVCGLCVQVDFLIKFYRIKRVIKKKFKFYWKFILITYLPNSGIFQSCEWEKFVVIVRGQKNRCRAQIYISIVPDRKFFPINCIQKVCIKLKKKIMRLYLSLYYVLCSLLFWKCARARRLAYQDAWWCATMCATKVKKTRARVPFIRTMISII